MLLEMNLKMKMNLFFICQKVKKPSTIWNFTIRLLFSQQSYNIYSKPAFIFWRVNFQLNSMQRLNEWVLVVSYVFYPPSFKNFPEMWVTWQLNTRSSVGQCRHNNVVVTGQPSVLDMYTNTLTLRIQQKKTHLNYSEMIAKLVLSLINKTEQHSV